MTDQATARQGHRGPHHWRAAAGHARRAAAPRLIRQAGLFLRRLYLTLTMALAAGLTLSGARPLHAVIHAMSTLSTSGITATGGLPEGGAGFAGEALIFVFFVFALTRRSFASGLGPVALRAVGRDREVRIAVAVVVVLPTVLFMRHWVGALEVDDLANAQAALAALWGSVFTVLSFLTTTGFVSESWAEARSWSGLPTPGLILLGLAMMGGAGWPPRQAGSS